MRRINAVVSILLVCTACADLPKKWVLVWSDEFDGAAHSTPNGEKWSYDLGGGGWGNRELQIYTNDLENVFLDGGGHLAIRAHKTSSGDYTSARLKTKGLFEVAYGKIEARIQIPAGQGIWTAFWMLGNDITEASWPQCGEIDILENIGREPTILHGTVHGPGYSGDKGITAKVTLPSNAMLSTDFHVYAVEWERDSIDFSIDGKSYAKVTPGSLPQGAKWVFDHPFFLLLNVAVGGQWPGYPDEYVIFPQTMLVDWVRVWKPAFGDPADRTDLQEK